MTKKKGTLLVWLTSEELMIYLNFNLHMLVNLWYVTLRTTDFFMAVCLNVASPSRSILNLLG